jgi:UDP-2,3-diacylglucosamine pyrophosphatase LpxH
MSRPRQLGRFALVVQLIACHRGHLVMSDQASEPDQATLCQRLLHPSIASATNDAARPMPRRKVIVSDLHLGPGDSDAKFSGIEDFYSDDAWNRFITAQMSAGPTDLIIAGDFIEFWQIASLRGDIPATFDATVQSKQVPIVGSNQASAEAVLAIVAAAHPSVFSALARFLSSGDHRVIVLAGNHDAAMQWPKVQMRLRHMLLPAANDRDRSLLFVQGDTYTDAGVIVTHGHQFDSANHADHGANQRTLGSEADHGANQRTLGSEADHGANQRTLGSEADQNIPAFALGADEQCRLQSTWGEVFVDRFYTETERAVPFIDNLQPVSAGVLWTLRSQPDSLLALSSAIRFFVLLKQYETRTFNLQAVQGLLQSAVGTAGSDGRGPDSFDDVVSHMADNVLHDDVSLAAVSAAALRLSSDAELASLVSAVGRALAKLPDLAAAKKALGDVRTEQLEQLHSVLFGDVYVNAATELVASAKASIVVVGHTHESGGSIHEISSHGKQGYYANSGSWIAVASVSDLQARGITLSQLALANRSMFKARNTSVIIDYDGNSPRAPVLKDWQ